MPCHGGERQGRHRRLQASLRCREMPDHSNRLNLSTFTEAGFGRTSRPKAKRAKACGRRLQYPKIPKVDTFDATEVLRRLVPLPPLCAPHLALALMQQRVYEAATVSSPNCKARLQQTRC